MTKQMTKIAMMILAIGLMAGAATAQNKNGGGGLAPVGIYTGVETSKGECVLSSATCYGDTFVMNSFGEWETHHLTVSLNYSMDTFVPNSSIVTGGSWSLVVIRDNQYAGTLYGKIQTGSINLITNQNGEEISKQTQANLLSTGGLGIFAGKESENLAGVYNAITDLRSKETTGNANFNF